MLVKDFMTQNPLTVNGDISVIEAAELMKRHRVRRFPVLRNNEVVGIVTDRDLRSAGPSQVINFDKAERKLFPDLYDLLTKITVKDIMTRNIVTISPEKTIVTASLTMLKHKITGLPVVDDQKRLIGILTEGDIFKALVGFSASHLGKTLIGLTLEDRPGVLKDVADDIRESGGRMASILSSIKTGEKQMRQVYIRLMDDPPVNLEELKKSLEKEFELLFVIEDDVAIP
ncbi:CBS domain protein [uncultured Desulfobacterium sp.]|uniref:CBS domain protein n=1 Tax=uncultured Desulfobacterium sp. TaxID=201089 RepID=A0A445N1H6_9BACT|nr:CBS domain protein [uncultured Desulfobacterium sp.]